VHFDKAAQGQARTHQQHASQCNLEDDQYSTDGLMLVPQPRACTGVREHFLEIYETPT
jgi:hypothetical protein